MRYWARLGEWRERGGSVHEYKDRIKTKEFELFTNGLVNTQIELVSYPEIPDNCK